MTNDNMGMDLKTKLRHIPIRFTELEWTKNQSKLIAHIIQLVEHLMTQFGRFKEIWMFWTN